MGARFERYVLDILPSLGFTPKALRYKIYRGDVEVGEVDILAVDNKGETYAIEVKAGRVDIAGIRQAYVNAKLIGAKPMVIARGYADEGARELAKELGVEVVLLPDYIFLSIDDLYSAFTIAFMRFVTLIAQIYTSLDEAEVDAIAQCPDVQCLCEKIDCEKIFKKLPKETKNYEYLITAVRLKQIIPTLCKSLLSQ
ncbi:MAG: restriction endonuclease [Pyrobaculum sp.]